jgi:hypothetical protein
MLTSLAIVAFATASRPGWLIEALALAPHVVVRAANVEHAEAVTLGRMRKPYPTDGVLLTLSKPQCQSLTDPHRGGIIRFIQRYPSALPNPQEKHPEDGGDASL